MHTHTHTHAPLTHARCKSSSRFTTNPLCQLKLRDGGCSTTSTSAAATSYTNSAQTCALRAPCFMRDRWFSQTDRHTHTQYTHTYALTTPTSITNKSLVHILHPFVNAAATQPPQLHNHLSRVCARRETPATRTRVHATAAAFEHVCVCLPRTRIRSTD